MTDTPELRETNGDGAVADDGTEHKGFLVDLNNLPSLFPTHRHSPMFWETLGRTIATFGFLEEVLVDRI